MSTLLLDTDTWDLALDVGGNIAVADDPYASLQDAASACRLFEGELYFDTTRGVPYFADVLGRFPSIEVLQLRIKEAAMSVPGVSGVSVVLEIGSDRIVTGQAQISVGGVNAVIEL